MPYDAVILDNDGVLTRPTPCEVYRSAIRLAFQEFGVVSPNPGHVDALVRNDAADVERICADYDVGPEAFWRERERRAAEAQRVELLAGGKPLYGDVAALRGLDCELGVASNNQHRTVEHVLDVHRIGDLFATAHGRTPSLDGLARRKPDPHYVEAALADLGVAPENAVYVGDSNCDVAAAAAAGVDSAFVRRGHRRDYVLERAPTYVIDGLADLGTLVEGGDSSWPRRVTPARDDT